MCKDSIVSIVAFIDKLEAVPRPGARQESAPSISAAAHRRHDLRLPTEVVDTATCACAGAGAGGGGGGGCPLQPWAGAGYHFQTSSSLIDTSCGPATHVLVQEISLREKERE